MTRRITFTALALLAFASLTHAGIVDPQYSTATMLNSPAVLHVEPGGEDTFLTPVDHTISVEVRDSGENPVELVASDIWLDNDASAPCPGGWTADSSTFAPAAGFTTFTAVPRGGVMATDGGLCRVEQTSVVAVGQTIAILDLRFVSADLTGDGQTEVADFGAFAGYFNAPCSDNAWCGDITKSNETEPAACVDVADFGAFAGFFNLSFCP
jgi:hypothetical protein